MNVHGAPFEDLVVAFAGHTVFLDVDGTLVPDGESDFSEGVMAKMRELSSKNQVLLCTNKRDPARFTRLEARFGLPVVTKRRRKPSPRVLTEAGVIARERIVIGDKFLTDALFARRIKARFIPVRRKLSGREPLSVRAVYWLDDALYRLVRSRC